MPDKPPSLTELHSDMRAVFLTPSGQRVLNPLCRTAYVNEATYCPGDSMETAHREGMRRIVLSILKFIDRDPQELLNLPKETLDE